MRNQQLREREKIKKLEMTKGYFILINLLIVYVIVFGGDFLFFFKKKSITKSQRVARQKFLTAAAAAANNNEIKRWSKIQMKEKEINAQEARIIR